MPIRDPDPTAHLGYGVRADHITRVNEEEGLSPGSSFIARSLHGHPVLKFLTVGAATLVGAHVAGQQVRKGGVRLLRHMSQRAAEGAGQTWHTTALKDYRKTQDIFDRLEGLTRRRGAYDFGGDAADPLSAAARHAFNEAIGDPTKDTVTDLAGFWFTQGERARAASRGMEASAAHWTLRDELQQRLVRQARRLPYELPAAYVVQRGLSDRLLGIDQEDRPNWYNPIDVLGDFATQSLKNITTAMLPFEAGQGAAVHGWRRFMTMADDGTHVSGMRANVRDVSVGLERTLRLVGHDAGEVLYQGVKRSRQFTGSFSSALHEAAGKSTTTRERGASLLRRIALRSHENKPINPGLRDLPGPFHDIRVFGRTFKQRWGQLGEELENFQGEGFTTVERLAKQLHDVSARRGTSDFRQGALRDEYSEMLREELLSRGASKGDADRFVRQVRIKHLPSRSQVNRGTADRSAESFLAWGDGPTIPGGQTFEQYLRRRMAAARGFERPDAIAANIEEAARVADRRFVSNRREINRRVDAKATQVRHEILRRGDDLLGQGRMPYAYFQGAVSPEAREDLVREAASTLGIRTVDPVGGSVSIQDLSRQVASRGLDPKDTYQMRALLVTRGRVSRPWRPGGENIFGLRKLTAEEALQRGYFGQNTESVRRTLEDFGQARPYRRGIPRTPLQGIYETAGGRILDLSSINRGFWRTADLIANEFQIPLIHFRPFQALGYPTFSGLREHGPVMIQSGRGRQPFVDDSSAGRITDSYMWFRTRGLKGRVVRVGDRGAQEMEGAYRPLSTEATGLVGRNLRLAIGDPGKAPTRPRRGWRRVFNVDEDQPDSLLRLFRRVQRRRDDPRNVTSFADMLARGGQTRAGRVLGDDELAEGMYGLIGQLRYRGFPPRVIDALRRIDPDLVSARIPLPQGGEEVLDFLASTAPGLQRQLDKYVGYQRLLINEGLMPAQVAEPTTRSLNRLVRARLTDEPVPSNVRSPSIHRRIDQVRQEIFQHNIVYNALLKGQGLNESFENLMGELQQLARAGQLTQRELTEARAALLSTHINFVGYTRYTRGMGDQDLLKIQAQALMPGGEITATRQVLGDIAQAKGHPIAGLPQRFLGFAGYDFPGATYNPFGGDTAFVPTFGTAVARRGIRAVGSVLGINTWRDQKAFSGLTIPFSHGITRLNRYFSALGLGLDASAFSGPADLYLRGMIGRRVFPAVATGTTAVMLDRQLGGLMNEEDPYGERVYSPYFLGKGADIIAELQVGAAGLLPGGQSSEEKARELLYGEVPIRRGRFWPFGRTPWRGGNEMYFRPSWYRRFKSGYQYTDQTFGSPLERLAFGYDFSPLRPFDPYRWEREHATDRPYPVTGEYFSGPWGPLTSVLNLTAGRILKPRRSMHEEEVAANLATFYTIGQGAMAQPEIGEGGVPLVPLGSTSPASDGARNMLGAVNAAYSQAAGGPGGASLVARGALGSVNAGYAAAAGYPRGGAVGVGGGVGGPGLVPTTGGSFPLPTGGRVYANPRTPFGVMAAMPPLNPAETVRGQFGYEMQELLGIYGFGFASLRESLGMGEKDFLPTQPVLASPSAAYGSGRGFWDLALGGLGDIPTPLEGEFANLEFSEVMRRFIPKPRRLDVVNPIVNELAFQAPWLPDKFQMGDPFTQVPEGELRLPGPGYERTHPRMGYRRDGYSAATRHAILGDVAWWSDEFRMLDRSIDRMDLTPLEQADVAETRRQVAAVRQVHDFTDYQYRYSSAEEEGMGEAEFRMRRNMERFLHADTWLHRKFMPYRTAVEDWESQNVYGQTFPQWQNPIADFLRPMFWQAANRNPLAAATSLGFVAGLFWRTPKTRNVARLIGAMTGLGASSLINTEEAGGLFGERWLPEQRRRELEVEEYADVLNYTRWRRLFEQSRATGDGRAAAQYRRRMQQTMYGADLYDSTPEELSRAIPKRKREHFLAMLQAPPQERARILSTAPRLERRLYEAAWGMKVEQRPGLEEYFQEHELPPPQWEGWSPFMDMEQVKLKIIQSQGLDAAQMGYYPQQVKQANLINPSYPDFGQHSSRRDVVGQLRALMAARGLEGSVTTRYTAFPGSRLQINAGVA